jgi:hypothetical protein
MGQTARTQDRQAGMSDRTASRSQAQGDRQASRSDRAATRGESQGDRQEGRTDRTESRQEGRTDRAEGRQDVRGDRQQEVTDRQKNRQDAARDISDDWHGDWDDWDDWDDHWGYFAAGAAVVAGAYAVGTIISATTYSSLSCTNVIVHGITYSQCGTTWYQPTYSGADVTYIVVNPPPGY